MSSNNFKFSFNKEIDQKSQDIILKDLDAFLFTNKNSNPTEENITAFCRNRNYSFSLNDKKDFVSIYLV